jgi:hypothetical protein
VMPTQFTSAQIIAIAKQRGHFAAPTSDTALLGRCNMLVGTGTLKRGGRNKGSVYYVSNTPVEAEATDAVTQEQE